MALSDRAATAASYAAQLLDNSDVQASARQAAQASRAAYKRARGKQPAEIVTDTTFRRRVTEATAAVGRLWGAAAEPAPSPPRRWPRVLFVILLGVGMIVAVTNEGLRTRCLALIGQNQASETPPPDESPVIPDPPPTVEE